MAVPKPLLSAQDLERMSGDDRHELVRGELVRMTPVGGEHGQVALVFGGRLLSHVTRHALGVVMVETGFVLARDPDTVRAPDVSFLATARVPIEGLPKGFIAGAPDLAVEIVSPEDTAAEVEAKVQEYLTAGTRLVLIVHPRTRTVTAYRPDGSAQVLRAGDTVSGGDVVPGFSLPVRELFGS